MPGSAPRWFTRPKVVIHPGNNWPQHRVTMLIEISALPPSQSINDGAPDLECLDTSGHLL